MTKIKEYMEKIDDELESAKEYAEIALELKEKNDSNFQRYKTFSDEELKHAMAWHDRAVAEINEISKNYQPTIEMQEKWDKSHKKYIEKTTFIKQMLQM